ncbi:MAG: hypothetical protein EA401_00530, partial [Planctomycetota bacterium]
MNAMRSLPSYLLSGCLAIGFGIAIGYGMVALEELRRSAWFSTTAIPIDGWEPRTVRRALRDLHTAGENGDREALTVLGKWYMRGWADVHSIGVDEIRGLAYLRAAADLMHPPAILAWSSIQATRGAMVQLPRSWIPTIENAFHNGDRSAASIMVTYPGQFGIAKEALPDLVRHLAGLRPDELSYSSLNQAREWNLDIDTPIVIRASPKIGSVGTVIKRWRA